MADPCRHPPCEGGHLPVGRQDGRHLHAACHGTAYPPRPVAEGFARPGTRTRRPVAKAFLGRVPVPEAFLPKRLSASLGAEFPAVLAGTVVALALAGLLSPQAAAGRFVPGALAARRALGARLFPDLGLRFADARGGVGLDSLHQHRAAATVLHLAGPLMGALAALAAGRLGVSAAARLARTGRGLVRILGTPDAAQRLRRMPPRGSGLLLRSSVSRAAANAAAGGPLVAVAEAGPALRRDSSARAVVPGPITGGALFTRRARLLLLRTEIVLLVVDEDGRLEIDAGLLGQFGSKLVGEHARADLLDRAFRQIAELERPEGEPDQPVHLQAEVLEDALHLAVLALAQPQRDPDVVALRAVDLGLDGAVVRCRRW